MKTIGKIFALCVGGMFLLLICGYLFVFKIIIPHIELSRDKSENRLVVDSVGTITLPDYDYTIQIADSTIAILAYRDSSGVWEIYDGSAALESLCETISEQHEKIRLLQIELLNCKSER